MSEKNKKIRKALTLGTIVAVGAAGASDIIKKGNTSTEVSAPKLAKIYRVEPGDTAWGIDEKAGFRGDPREFTYQLDRTLPKDREGLLVPGDEIALPSNSKVGIEETVYLSDELPAFVPPQGGIQGDYPPPPPQG